MTKYHNSTCPDMNNGESLGSYYNSQAVLLNADVARILGHEIQAVDQWRSA